MTQEEKNHGWFWTMFGGTLIGLMGLLLATILTYFNSNLVSIRNDISDIAERVAAAEGRREVYKEKSAVTEAMLQKIQDRLNLVEQTRDSLRSDFQAKYESNLTITDTLKETNKELREEIKAITEKISELSAENKAISEKLIALSEKTEPSK